MAVYGVRLFTGDMKFTNDYSNVLQFDTKQARDDYFDNYASISGNEVIDILNTQENKVFFNGGSIKLTIKAGVSDADLNRISYCFIETSRFKQTQGAVEYDTSRTYYFINSYNIISSNENLTVVQFILEYDVWMNNQFDFTIRESNVERSHMDRWDKDGKIIYNKPILDAVDCEMKEWYTVEEPNLEMNIIRVNEMAPTATYRTLSNIIWAMVTCTHSVGKFADQLVYHFIPLLYKYDNIFFRYRDVTTFEYYLQNCIAYSAGGENYPPRYFPSLQCLSNAFLKLACSLNDSDTVKICNIQIFKDLPLRTEINNKSTPAGDIPHTTVKFLNAYELNVTSGRVVPNYPNIIFMSYYLNDLSEFIINPKNTVNNNACYKKFLDPIRTETVRPNDGDVYNPMHEIALLQAPVVKRYIKTKDNTAIAEIPSEIYKEFFNHSSYMNNGEIELYKRISFSSTSAYTYIELFDETRAVLSQKGFAFNSSAYLYDFISDAWYDYVVTQRDSDRMMMWTNIATGGISELGSTAVSAGIGYRSNIERARALENYANIAQDSARGMTGNREQSTLMNVMINSENSAMYRAMAKNAMYMSAIGGVTAFASNAMHQAIAQRAKEKSIQNTPATLACAGNADGAIVDDTMSLIYVVMRCDDTAFNQYKNIFMKYGYFIGSVLQPNIKSRKFFNYLKTNGAILTGSANQQILAMLASIFDNGVTIWHMDYTTYNTLYDYTYENIERSLM